MTTDQVRRALASSPRWNDATRDLPLMPLARMGPIDFDICSPAEMQDIADWATGKTDAMPAHLVAYLGAVREATR